MNKRVFADSALFFILSIVAALPDQLYSASRAPRPSCAASLKRLERASAKQRTSREIFTAAQLRLTSGQAHLDQLLKYVEGRRLYLQKLSERVVTQENSKTRQETLLSRVEEMIQHYLSTPCSSPGEDGAEYCNEEALQTLNQRADDIRERIAAISQNLDTMRGRIASGQAKLVGREDRMTLLASEVAQATTLMLSSKADMERAKAKRRAAKRRVSRCR